MSFTHKFFSELRKVKFKCYLYCTFSFFLLLFLSNYHISSVKEDKAYVFPNKFQKLKNFKIIAHRGASAYTPENTLTAFAKAIELGANMIELDVRQTKDGHLIVIHDATVDRTTNGKGRVGDLTIDEIRALDAGSWFSDKFKNEKIPLLEEVLIFIPDSIELLIEIKENTKSSPNIEDNVIELIRKYKPAVTRYGELNEAVGAVNRVIIKSFEDVILDSFRKSAPEIPLLKIFVCDIDFLGLVIEKGLRLGSALNDRVQYLQSHWLCTTESYIKKTHERGYTIFAWDLNNESRMKKLIELGIDGIETDYPDLLKKVLLEYLYDRN